VTVREKTAGGAPYYDWVGGEGAITVGDGVIMTHGYFNGGSGDNTSSWLGILSHEVDHASQYRSMGYDPNSASDKASWLYTFGDCYIESGSHNACYLEIEADAYRRDYYAFNSFVSQMYGFSIPSALDMYFGNDAGAIGFIDRSWDLYQRNQVLNDYGITVDNLNQLQNSKDYTVNITEGHLNLRSGAGTDNSIIGSLENGAGLVGTGREENGFIQVYSSSTEQTGWVSKDYIR
jgi:hypothetical protein